MQSALNPLTVQDFFHFLFFCSFDNHRERQHNILPWDQVIGHSMYHGGWEGVVLLDGIRDVQIVDMGSSCLMTL